MEEPKAYRRPPTRAGIDLWLDANEGPPLEGEVAPLDPETLRRYPDASELERVLARRHGLTAERVLVTAGADDAIDRCCRATLRGGAELLLATPSFEMFERYAALAGGTRQRVPWPEDGFPTDALIAASNERTRMVAVVSPNNPTGQVASPEDLRRLREGIPGALLVVDAAYGEFADDDLTAMALGLGDTVVLRTFSKARGLAGARVGYALGSPDWIERLRACGPPYAVSGPSLALALASLQREDDVERTVRRVRAERTRLEATLRDLDLHVLESQANFVFARSSRASRTGAWLQALGIAVRTWPDPPDLRDALRITCPGRTTDFARLERALHTVLRPQALLFDMDGVLADEGPSYRESIVRTCASWGVEVDRGNIVAMKREGGANDDWDVTRRLLARAGVELERREVIDRFESFYQGTRERAGLWERERLLANRELLRRLAARMPLAVVTGRPRRDALRFLERFDLLELFPAVVCLEDATPKPDPAPVLLALRRLGVENAWMIGDTPDDLRAARAARVLPLGVVAPDAADAVSAEALRAAGAAEVLPHLRALEELL